MGKKNLGRVSPIFKGPWDPEVRYEELDNVLYDGKSWVALGVVIGTVPGTDDTKWIVAVERGAQGIAGEYAAQGIQGATGRDGQDGIDGAQGATGQEGPQGATGRDGQDGQDGAQGAIGQEGPQGAIGRDGQNGIDGAQGATGQEGPQGATGSVSGTTEQWTFTLEDSSTVTKNVYVQ